MQEGLSWSHQRQVGGSNVMMTHGKHDNSGDVTVSSADSVPDTMPSPSCAFARQIHQDAHHSHRTDEEPEASGRDGLAQGDAARKRQSQAQNSGSNPSHVALPPTEALFVTASQPFPLTASPLPHSDPLEGGPAEVLGFPTRDSTDTSPHPGAETEHSPWDSRALAEPTGLSGGTGGFKPNMGLVLPPHYCWGSDQPLS